MHPKVKAATGTAAIIAAVAIALFGLAGVKLDSDIAQTIGVAVAALLPALAGYLKSA